MALLVLPLALVGTARLGMLNHVFGDDASEQDSIPDCYGKGGYCSWCLQYTVPELLEYNVLTKDWYRCSNSDCQRGLHICRTCENYACWDKYCSVNIHDQCCACCNGTVPNFERFTEVVSLASLMEYRNLFLQTTIATAALSPELLALRLTCGISLKDLVSGIHGVGCPRDCENQLDAPLASRASQVVVHLCASHFDTPFCFKPQSTGAGDPGHTVITINGFTQENADLQDWASLLQSSKFKNWRWVHLDWESGTVIETLAVAVSGAAAAATAAVVATGVNNEIANSNSFQNPGMALNNDGTHLSYATIAGVAAGVAVGACLGFGSIVFERAKRRAKMVGYVLADVLARCPSTEHVVLMGHSLGGKVIHECLRNFQRRPQGTGTVIDEVHLLGACTTSNSSKWVELSNLGTKIYNHHSQNDFVVLIPQVLDTAVKQDCVPELAGRCLIDNVPGVVNVDHSSDVSGHRDWIKPGIC